MGTGAPSWLTYARLCSRALQRTVSRECRKTAPFPKICPPQRVSRRHRGIQWTRRDLLERPAPNRIANHVARFFAAVAANRDACEEVTGAVATPRTDPSTLPAASKPQGMTPTQNRRSWTDIFGARQRPQHHNCQYQGPGGPQLHASCGQLTVEALLKDPQNPEARLSCCHALSTVAFPSIRSTLARPLASSPHHPSSGTIHSTLTRTGPDLWEEGPMDVRR